MTRITVTLVLLFFLAGCGNEQKDRQHSTDTASKAGAPVKPENNQFAYRFNAPDNWGKEQMHFPIEFAPVINHNGLDELRFAPGWSDGASEGYWSYCFLWWLEGKVSIDTGVLRTDLEAYYTGLVGRNIQQRLIPAEKVIPVKVGMAEVKTEPNDKATYSGQVIMLDYMKQVPMTLNVKVHVRDCEAQEHTAVYFCLSPKKAEHAIWSDFDRILQDFACSE